MTEFVLNLIPEYGLYLVFFVVMFACMGIPLPASVIVLTAGGLAAAGDLVIWQVLLIAFIAFVVGDQLAFNSARIIGPSLLMRARRVNKIAKLVDKSENLLNQRGLIAVFLSRTIFSAIGPYVGVASGALHMRWILFSSVAAIAALVWASTYGMAGYLFAGQLPELNGLVVKHLIAGTYMICSILLGFWIHHAWIEFENKQ